MQPRVTQVKWIILQPWCSRKSRKSLQLSFEEFPLKKRLTQLRHQIYNLGRLANADIWQAAKFKVQKKKILLYFSTNKWQLEWKSHCNYYQVLCIVHDCIFIWLNFKVRIYFRYLSKFELQWFSNKFHTVSLWLITRDIF